MIPAPSPAGTRCPGCGGEDLTDVFSSDRAPVYVGLLHDSAEGARAAATGAIALAFCHGCGLVHNRRFEPDRLAFAPGYDAALYHSPLHRAYLEALADRLVERWSLRGRTVLEIGCGTGHFLRLLCERGIGRAIGVDPALPTAGSERVGAADVAWVRERLEPGAPETLGAWDFVCSLSVFEDLARPLDFVAGLRELCVRRGAAGYVEVFHAARAFEQGETWSVHYEQCNYFGPESLTALFRRGGFRVLDAGPCFEGGRSLFVEFEPGSDPDIATAPRERLPLPAALAGLAARHEADLAAWTARLAALDADGRRVVLWGSGGKGIAFLAAVPTSGRIACVIDLNPERQGRWVPIRALPVLGPEALVELRPDVVILSNRLYENEIRAHVRALGLACEFLAA